MSPESTQDLDSLHVASESMRWRILNALAEGPKTASVLAAELDTTPQHINFHTMKLENVGLVKIVRIDPPEGGMKLKEFHLVPREWVVRVSSKGTMVSAKAVKA